MFLRIQQGFLRGRRIPAPPEIKGQAHFTPALVKEAVFQLLSNRCEVDRTAFFDLCAGSGQMGFEAFSRGFRPVILAEIDPGRVALLRKVSAELAGGAGGRVEVLRRDFRRMNARLLAQERAVLFLDPPYSFWTGAACPPLSDFLALFGRALNQARANDRRARSGLVLVQGPAGLPAVQGGVFSSPETRRHGRHILSLLEFSAGPDASVAEKM